MATACARTITLLYIYLYVWGLDLRLNNVNYSCWYFSSSVSHHILILNLWNTIQLKYHNQWVSYLWYSDHLMLSGQFQKAITLFKFFLKKHQRSLDIVIEWSWYRWTDESKVHLVTRITSVITMIWAMSYNCTAWFIPHLMAKSLASIDIMFMAWWTDLVMISCLLYI